MGQCTVKGAVAKRINLLIVSFWLWVLSFNTVHAEYDCESETSAAKAEGCPPDLSSLQGIILRIVTIGISLLGVLVLFLLVKAGIQIMTAGDDQEKKAKGIKQLQITILGLLGIFASYGLIVLIAKWLGVVEGPLSFIRGGQIIFDFILPAGTAEPVTP